MAGYFYQDNMSALGHTAVYTYDGVNRLKTAAATGNVAYNQTYTFTGDGSNGQYGNMSCTASPSNPKCLAPTYSATTNQIAGYTYDGAGNVTNDGTFGYQWDAEGKLTAITLSGNTIATNVYNALGRNVRHVGSGETTDEVYGADGFLLWRYTGSSTDPKQRSFVPYQGRILAEYYGGSPGGTLFDHPEELGSLSTAIDYATSHSAERLFYPFGELWTGSDLYSLAMHQTFAQLPDYDNDSNSDLYNTLNRHYSPMGRWLSPDPGGVKVVKLDDPQTWNMYGYVRNNPTTFTDPTGLDLWMSGCGKETTTCHNNYVGTYNDKGKFIPTTIQSDAEGNFKGHNVTFDTSGIHIDNKYQGVFASGTAATVINGSGVMAGFQLTANTNNFGTTTAGGLLRALPGHSLSELGSVLTHIRFEDVITGHPGTQLRGGNINGPDIHVSFEAGANDVSAHFDWRYPGTWAGFQQHYRDYRAYQDRSKTMTSDPDYDLVGPQPED